MTHYYLMPQKWYPSSKTEMSYIKGNWDWIRYIETTRKKGEQAATDYELELNDGVAFSLDKVIKGETLFNVHLVPNSQARDFNTYDRWPCNKELFPD